MKEKKEYVSPKMESVKLEEKQPLLVDSCQDCQFNYAPHEQDRIA